MANLVEFSIWRIQEMANLGDGEFSNWRIQQLANLATGEFSNGQIQQLANLANGKLSKWKIRLSKLYRVAGAYRLNRVQAWPPVIQILADLESVTNFVSAIKLAVVWDS